MPRARIIPASAGQTEQFDRVILVIVDHPRECGANGLAFVVVPPHVGSSPRVRGKQRWVTHEVLPQKDHPRECGANADVLCLACCRYGSSPRVRGKRVRHARHEGRRRIIPASAGQTGARRRCPLFGADHPRECGANLFHKAGFLAVIGSSPRVRGKPCGRGVRGSGRRIIPASAGQTTEGHSNHAAASDHPRECGANVAAFVHELHGCGSSPRVRGKPLVLIAITLARRIIPASAGQTAGHDDARYSPSDHPRECGANV